MFLHLGATATAGTASAFASGTHEFVTSYIITARVGNSSAVYIGNSGVSATAMPWQPGDIQTWSANDKKPYLSFSDFYIDTAVSGDGIDAAFGTS